MMNGEDYGNEIEEPLRNISYYYPSRLFVVNGMTTLKKCVLKGHSGIFRLDTDKNESDNLFL